MDVFARFEILSLKIKLTRAEGRIGNLEDKVAVLEKVLEGRFTYEERMTEIMERVIDLL